MAGTGIGTFNDRLRDGARGGGPFSGIQEQGFVTGLSYDPNAHQPGLGRRPAGALLLEDTDWIRVGLAGNLADYTLRRPHRPHRDGAARSTTTASRPATRADPQEVINYVEAHDNETLFDAIQLKAPRRRDWPTRVRMQNLGMSLVALGQGIPFFHAGVELLRSKSLDRNSYNSGDWFNKLDFTYSSNNWGVGLPPAGDNQSNWPIMRPLLANPALKPRAADILARRRPLPGDARHPQELAALPAAHGRGDPSSVRFYNTGPDQIPGLIVMDV